MTPSSLNACVVGSEGGIGRAVVERLQADGWGNVIRMDRNGPVEIDISDETSVEKAFGRVKEDFRSLDLLVVTAGILDLEKMATLSVARWREVLDVNLTGSFLCCRAGRPLLRDGGRIVLMSSLAARTGGILTGTAYVVSKGGIESLTKALAQELAPHGITVNCVSPGGVNTAMLAQSSQEARARAANATPLKREATPQEIAGAIAYLASADAAFITGAILAVNGGARMD